MKEHVGLVWEHGYGMSLARFHGGVVEYIIIRIQGRLHPEILKHQSDSHRVDWFKW